MVTMKIGTAHGIDSSYSGDDSKFLNSRIRDCRRQRGGDEYLFERWAGLYLRRAARNNRVMKAVIAVLCLGLLGGCAEGTPNAEAPDDSDELYEDDPIEQTAGSEAKPAADAEDDAEPASE